MYNKYNNSIVLIQFRIVSCIISTTVIGIASCMISTTVIGLLHVE